ncbi:MAG: hypothetical protein K8H90_00155, partial [Thermoanaerobaculia bacterium]|nr:hypothetical protein [Thermoanaerobaculia bacterium]
MPEAERPRRHRRLAFATAALFVAGIQPAFAVDGVGEINQTCALATGCFAGDTPGFPVAIRSGGSYRLTGDLDLRVVPNAHEATAIDIQTSEAGGATVTLDLNGFALIGPVVCDGNGQNCA